MLCSNHDDMMQRRHATCTIQSGIAAQQQVLTATNAQQLIQQKAFATAVGSNHYNRNHRSRDAAQSFKALFTD